jgi:hypothetical protein
MTRTFSPGDHSRPLYRAPSSDVPLFADSSRFSTSLSLAQPSSWSACRNV